jgi:asparagine synthase (glutamine-hydrolysing)
MMRNAMKGIVPDLVLERKRKASVQRAPIAAFHKHRGNLDELFRSSLLVSHGFIELSRLNAALERTCTTSTAEAWPSLLRAINLEIWLRGLSGKVSRARASAAPRFPRKL